MEKKAVRKRLKNWKAVITEIDNPKDRPNDLQGLVLKCLKNGMNVRDASRVFDVSEFTIREWRRKYGGMKTLKDQLYFMNRSRQLGADDETIAEWFGLDRADKVAMMLAEGNQ